MLAVEIGIILGGLWVEVTSWCRLPSLFTLCARSKPCSYHWRPFPSVCSASVSSWLQVGSPACLQGATPRQSHISVGKWPPCLVSANGKLGQEPSSWRFGASREAASTLLHSTAFQVSGAALCFLPSHCWQLTPTPPTKSSPVPTISNLWATSLGLEAALVSLDCLSPSSHSSFASETPHTPGLGFLLPLQLFLLLLFFF